MVAWNVIPMWERACSGRRSDEGVVSVDIHIE